MNAIEEFQAIMEKLKVVSLYGFKGYSVDKILTVPTYEVLEGAFKMSFSFFLRSLLSSIFKKGYHYSFETISNAKVVLFYSHNHALRSDYVSFMQTVASCSEDVVLFTGSLNRKKRLFSNLKIRLSCFKLIFLVFSWLYSLFRAGIQTKYWKKFTTSLLESYIWKSLLEKNRKYILSIKCMVSIFDAREYENVFTQFLTHNGIPTATLQHGHFGKEYYYDPQNFYVGIEYRGFVSDFFLLWGECSYKNALECGIPESKLIKVGCPSLITPLKVEWNRGSIGLLFDGGDNAVLDNKNMYEIVKRFADCKKKRLIVKLHPSFMSEEYSYFIDRDSVELFSGDMKSFAENVELAVCGNTSSLITLLIWGHPILHYSPVFMADYYSELRHISFSNENELIKLYNMSVSPADLLSLYTELGDVKGNYRNAFNKIVKNK